ncbi:zyxin-like [Sinocyclocheilus rhinocerous]|uniref:zyxin-like n=1 Tax=Sinocyclocheilus rhinocerous TaxID=307959 RepID=UPI0007B931C0|nr:PREDICTED: zyxin-like [Sinocyclocheilus rhinocerous]
MADSSTGKPMVVTSSVSLKVTAPSFYNQPKRFASVAPPRPKGQMAPSQPSSFVSTGVIGRVGEMPPPPSTLCEDFPPPPPPLDDAELPDPPPECQLIPPVSDAPPPAFPAPPPVAEDLNLPASPEELTSVPSRLFEKQTSFDRQLGSLTNMLSEMETSGPFNPKHGNLHIAQSSFPPPPPAAPPAPVPRPANIPAPAPTFNHSETSPTGSQQSFAPPSPAAPKISPVSSFNRSAGNTVPPKVSGSGSGPGGAPLTMREVEELEKMTKDFIKDMDNHPPVITSPATEVCGKCGEALSRSQPAVRAMDKLYHSHCFCCVTCRRPLQGMQFYDCDRTPQCEDCYMNSLAVCSRCGERITDRVLKAVGQSFHAHCFLCSTCGCTLEGAPFITDDKNNPYCVKDYHRRFSPLCVSCNEPIIPDPGSEETVRVVALEKNFHLKCYRCEDCARPLSIEADADGCYPFDGRILCMKCHTQRAKQAKH